MAEGGTATTALIVAVLGAGGLGAIIAAVITGLFSKRKLGAEAAEIITKAAAGVVTNLNNEIVRVEKARVDQDIQHRATMAAQKAEHEMIIASMIHDREVEMRDVRAVLQLHVAWDALALSKLSEIGIDLPPVPPLLPPRLEGEKG